MISAADEAAGSSEVPAMREQWIKTSAELLQGLANLEGVLYRLQSYMLPRIPALDSSALASAIRQGNADFRESQLVANRCAVECIVYSNRGAVCSVTVAGRQFTVARLKRTVLVKVCCSSSPH